MAAYIGVIRRGDGDVVLSGADAGDFNIVGGVLTFKTPPDFETPTDGKVTGGDQLPMQNNVYELTVTAKDAVNNENMQDVIVRVTNVEEDGVIMLSTLAPQEDVPLTATLTDSDVITDTGVIWHWARGTRATGPWTNIDRDESAIGDDTDSISVYNPGFKPVGAPTNYASDVGMYLRVTATYRDGFCASCNTDTTAQVITDNAVLAKAYVNAMPRFLDEDGEPETAVNRSIEENSPAGTAVGAPVKATDPGRNGPEVLTYSIAGTDASSFEIDTGTGQIKVGSAVTALNYDGQGGKKTYVVEVRAADPSGASGGVMVNIAVTDVDEAPEIASGGSSIPFAENTPGTTALFNYTATDQENDSIVWSLTGSDAVQGLSLVMAGATPTLPPGN